MRALAFVLVAAARGSHRDLATAEEQRQRQMDEIGVVVSVQRPGISASQQVVLDSRSLRLETYADRGASDWRWITLDGGGG